MEGRMDTLRHIINSPVGTAMKGTGGILITFWEALPDIVRIGIGIATIIHIIVKIRKDLK
jgi:hypothetical protein